MKWTLFHRCGNYCENLIPTLRDQPWIPGNKFSITSKRKSITSYNTWFKPTQLISTTDAHCTSAYLIHTFRTGLTNTSMSLLDAAHAAGLGDINVVYIIETPPMSGRTAPSQGHWTLSRSRTR
jgi:ABC-type amino acid transport system permease subunit